MPCFMVGYSHAKLLADTLNVPLIEVSHQQGHVAASLWSAGHMELLSQPHLAWHLSGGTTELLNAGFTDSFRYLYPDRTDAYSWWSYRAAARERNVGWRIDYFVVSDRLRENIKDAYILPEVMGSDHCPVGLDITW